MKSFKAFWAISLLVLVFAGCEKEDSIPETEKINPTKGVFILNQGSQSKSYGSLSYLDFETNEFVADFTDGKLGDSPQDILVYGAKLYVSVTVSNRIWIFDLDDLNIDRARSIDPFDDEGKPHQPNYFVAKGNKVYVTTVSGNVLRIDTTSLAIDGILKSGSESDGIAEYNGKLYVANTNRIDYTTDNTLSVIDIASFSVENKIPVGDNPFIVKSDGKGCLYLSYRGIYQVSDEGFQKIDLNDGNKITEMNIPANQDFTILDNTIYYFGVVYDDSWNATNHIGKYNLSTNSAETWITLPDNFATIYALGIDPENKDAYIAETDYSTEGTIYVYSKDGALKTTFTAGINPYRFVFKH